MIELTFNKDYYYQDIENYLRDLQYSLASPPRSARVGRFVIGDEGGRQMKKSVHKFVNIGINLYLCHQITR